MGNKKGVVKELRAPKKRSEKDFEAWANGKDSSEPVVEPTAPQKVVSIAKTATKAKPKPQKKTSVPPTGGKTSVLVSRADGSQKRRVMVYATQELHKEMLVNAAVHSDGNVSAFVLDAVEHYIKALN